MERGANGTGRPSVFLSHTSEDAELAERLARDLVARGLACFYSPWSIQAGDSLVATIDDGLENCTHFLVLLTPRSIDKPWVEAEMDAAFVERVQGRCRFIVVRKGLEASKLPPLLSALLSPSLDGDYQGALEQLVRDIYGVTRAPKIGPVPQYAAPTRGPELGLSDGAARLVQMMVERSRNAVRGDPEFPPGELLDGLQLTPDDLEDIVLGELEPGRLVVVHRDLRKRNGVRFHTVGALPRLFTRFDRAFGKADPIEGAKKLAALLVNSKTGYFDVRTLATELDWKPRRMNPAFSYLLDHRLVDAGDSICAEFLKCDIRGNERTRRFVKENS